jgi:tellurite resistance protein TerC
MLGFVVFVIAMLALDLGVFQRHAHKPSIREAILWSITWIALALLFNLGMYLWFGQQAALEFFTGYVIEKSLSVDNLFVFLVIFSYFRVPSELQHRVLFWGILGALILRGIFIAAGAALLESFHWTIYVFGGLLLLTGIRLFLEREKPFKPQENPLLRLFSQFMPIRNEYRGASFTVIESGRRYATPLLLALIVVEGTDLIFAFDSIPAIFAITRDPFIVFTSNVFAILGLRSLYFLLSGVLLQFHYLRPGLALVLGFVGLKLLVSGIYQVPIVVSLFVVSLLIGGSILLSIVRQRRLSQTAPHISTHGK